MGKVGGKWHRETAGRPALLFLCEGFGPATKMGEENMMRGESSVEVVTRDGFLVSIIVGRLSSVNDRLSASIVCKLWNDAVVWNTHYLNVRSPSLLPRFVQRYSHIKILSFRQSVGQLQDRDLLLAASSFGQLQELLIGHPELRQQKITSDGLLAFVRNSDVLQTVRLCRVSNLRDAGVLALCRGCRHLTSIDLESCRNLTDDAIDALSHCQSLKELALKGLFGFTPSGLARIGENCGGLLKVCLHFESLDISLALRSLAVNCQKLGTLSLTFRHGDLGELSRCSSLVSLHIEMDNRNNADVPVTKIAAANRNLKKFSYFSRLAPLNDAAVIAILHNCRSLERLCLEASALHETTIVAMAECKSINCIALDHLSSEGQALAAIGLSGMQLKEFSVRFGRGIWDGELGTLIRCNKQLELINLQCCLGPSASGFSAIAGCANLQNLDLSFTEVDNVSLAAIANGARVLRHLSLVKCEAVSSMEVLSNFKALEYLNLDQCPFVSDGGLDLLAVGCSKLTDLSLASTRITDIGISYLTNCSLLRTLRIPYCRGVQGPGLITIAKSCSWLRYLVISHQFRDTRALEELKKQYCMVQLDVDDLALVPFGFYALDEVPR